MNLFELFVKVGVDDQASGKLKDIGSKLGNGLKTAAKIGTAAVGAAAAGITALTTAAVNNYAEYEQLVGGVDTLFQSSSQKVQEYAANAYKTAGMSANEYMSTVTSFSASLLQSLGGDTDKAAEYANQALTDMSDNANKMGTSMEMIQNAYQGFAKQNYTMLDNLKLGYGGTKEEMARLIEDAAKLSDTVDAQDMSFANIVKAINVVQTEMGITGTTALEAGRTISGSVGAMKSAWTNLVTGFADGNADIEGLINNLVTTIVGDGTENNLGVIGNVLPAIETALGGIVKLIEGAAPKIIEILPGLIDRIVPTLISAATSLVDSVLDVLPGLLETVVKALNDNLPILAEAAISIVQSLVDGISENQEMLMTTALETITYLANSLISMLPQIVQLGLDLIVSLAMGIAESLPELIPTIIDVILEIVNVLTDPENLSMLLDAALTLVTELAFGLVDAIPALVDAVITLIENLVLFLLDPENIAKLLVAAVQIVVALATGLVKAIPKLSTAGLKIISSVFKMFTETDWGELGKNIIDGLKNGILRAWDNLKTWFKGLFGDLIGIAKKILGIHSPSTLFRDEIGKNIALGVAEGIEENADEATKAAADMAKSVYDKSKKWLDKNTKLYKYSAKEQLEVWEAIQSQFIKESKQYADAEEKIFDLRMQIRDEFTSKIKEIFEEISDIEQDYADTLESTTENIASAFGLFEQVEQGEVLSGQQLIKNMQDQITATERFYGALEELSARGVGDALVDEIREMGMGAADELYALLRLSDEQLTQFDDLFEKKMSLAAEIAEKELAGVRATADAGILGNLQEISALQDEATLYGGDDYEIVEETVEFSQSGLGISSAGVVNGLSADGQTESNQTFKINLVLPDGTPLASYLLDPLVRFANANGTPILNPI